MEYLEVNLDMFSKNWNMFDSRFLKEFEMKQDTLGHIHIRTKIVQIIRGVNAYS